MREGSMLVPSPWPIVSLYAQKWDVRRRDILGKCMVDKVVRARVEVARALWNSGYNHDQIRRLLQKDRTTVLYYLALGAKGFKNREGITVMAKRKLTNAQRAELIQVHEEGGHKVS